MAKLNSSYNNGFYIPDDYNLDRHEEQQKAQRRDKRDFDRQRFQAKQAGPRREGETVSASDIASMHGAKKRQTWMLEFSTICEGCSGLIQQGTKLYADVVKLKEKYLRVVALYELTVRCPLCSVNKITFVTDPTTSSYNCVQGGRRAAGGRAEWAAKEKEAAPDAKADATAGSAPEGSEELAKRLERHQKALLESEAIDDEVSDELRKLFFPPTDVIAELTKQQERIDAERAAALLAADEALLDSDAKAAAREEFLKLRQAFAKSKGSPQGASTGALERPAHAVLDGALGDYAAVVESDELEEKHAAMIAAISSTFTPTPRAAVAAPTKRSGGLLAALQDY